MMRNTRPRPVSNSLAFGRVIDMRFVDLRKDQDAINVVFRSIDKKAGSHHCPEAAETRIPA